MFFPVVEMEKGLTASSTISDCAGRVVPQAPPVIKEQDETGQSIINLCLNMSV